MCWYGGVVLVWWGVCGHWYQLSNISSFGEVVGSFEISCAKTSRRIECLILVFPGRLVLIRSNRQT